MTEKRIITPDDPGFYTEQSQAPLVMGDAYEDGLIKRLAAKHQKDIPAIRYAASNIAHCPENWYKTAQLTGVNNIMTQPMWFSPIHTPQSWQTPSKRRESYAWCRHFYECLAADTPILLANGKEIDIASVKAGMSVISGDGSIQKVLNVFDRVSHETILYVYISDREQPLRVTKNHIIPRVLYDAATNEVGWVPAENLNTDSYLYCPSLNGEPVQWKRVVKIEEKDYYGVLYDLEIDNVHSYVANGSVVHNSEPKVAAAIDFYSRFPQNGFKLQYPEGTRAKSELLRKVLAFYEHHVVKKLKLAEKMKQMSSEYFMLGDVFVHCDIACEHCFTADTMVTTNAGHKLICDIQVDDRVLGLDNKYHNVIATMSHKYDGQMARIKMSYLPDLVCTHEHKVYCVRGHYYKNVDRNSGKNKICINKKLTNFDNIELVKACDVKRGDYLVVPICDTRDEGNYLEEIIVDESKYYLKNKQTRKVHHVKIDAQFMSLMGWYVAEGSTDSNRFFSWALRLSTEIDIAEWIKSSMESIFGIECKIKPNHFNGDSVAVVGYSRGLSAWFDEQCGHGSHNKKVPQFIFQCKPEMRRIFLEALANGDGYSRRNENSIATVSKTLAYDVVRLQHSVKLPTYIGETEERTDYLGIHHKHSYHMGWSINKTKEGRGSYSNDKYQFYRVQGVEMFFSQCTVYNMTVAEEHNYVAGGVFVKNCLGTAKNIETKEECDHHGGMINRLTIFNPDWIEVQQSPLSDDPVMVMIADEQVQQIVHKRQPKDLYDRIPDHIKELILSRKPIPLSNKTTFHLKHMGPPYASYGTSLIRRLFMTLAYKTKIMTANWIVAERLILPIRIAKVGSDERPATVADIADVQQQLAATANEPNLVIVTHNNFEMDFIGATGKILQVTQEMEHIDKEILDGMMLNQALLNGEAPSYSSAQVGVETLIRRIESWRNTLAEAIEDNVFKPLAEMQGFVDEERSDEVGEQVFLYPRIKWNDLELKDKNQWYQILMQLHDKQVISTQTLCEELDLNYDQEVRRMRYEQVAVGPAGGSLGGGGDMAGGMGMAGGGGGGGIGGAAGDASGASSPMSAGGAGIGLDGGGMGGPAGAGMGGAGGGAAAGGMGGGPTAGALGGKILKKGKAGKQDEQEPVPAVPVKLTQIEQDMARMLTDICHVMNINNQNVRIQYPCVNPKGGKPFLMDFAIPHLKLACECNGSYWHSQPQQIEHDKERDTLLAQRGWTVLRFDDQAIENAPHAVKETITSYIKKAMSHHKHASIDSSVPVTLFFSFMKGELQEISEHF